MKRLEKIRLINWHRFVNETIELDDSVLLSGENGSGKSTLLDAIQFVITCTKANFNIAAQDKGNRNLNSYMRCKTGREDRPFERTGEITSHIALQFYDEERKHPFIAGAVMDSSSEEKEPNVIWYIMENRELSDEFFLRGDQVKSISAFRATNKSIKSLAKTQTEAKKMMLARFGRLHDKFFSLIPKALAFKPINDIKDFVYSYVLDAKDVNIETLKENVRSYQDLERMLNDVRARLGELEKINEKEAEVEKYLRVDRHQEYYLARVDVDLTKEAGEEAESKKQYAKRRQQELKRQKDTISKTAYDLQETIPNLTVELNGAADYQAHHELERRRDEMEELLARDRELMPDFRKAVSEALSTAKMLSRRKESDPCIRKYAEHLAGIESCENLSDISLCLEKVTSWKKEMYGQIQQRLAETRVSFRERDEAMTELRARISQLEKKRLSYAPAVTTLMQKIREEFHRVGRSGDVRVLCELLEITNPAWQNAVEGYLNNQRFYLLVEPDDFDLALSVYDKLRENKKAYGVGLINTGKLEEYDEVPEGSLAEVVTSKSIWARRYVNMVLGRVHRAQRYQDLKQYPTAITRQCMRYQNHVVSAIKPEVYQTPYIGAEAYLRQLEQCREQEKALRKELDVLQDDIRNLESFSELLDSEADMDVKYSLHLLEDTRNHQDQYAHCLDGISKLEENQTLIQKQLHLQNLRHEIQSLRNDISEKATEIGKCEQEESQWTDRIAELAAELSERESVLAAVVDKLGDEISDCSREYEQRIKDWPLERFKDNYLRSRQANRTSKENAEADMSKLMRDYKTAHDFGAAETMAGYS